VRLVDPGLFDNEHMSLEELEEKMSTPGATIFTEAGATLEYPNAIQEASPSTYTGNELQLAETAKVTADMLTPYNAAMSGEGTSGVRSAKHFDGQREQGEVNLSLLNDSVKRFNNELAECYFYAAQSLYGGMYRSFHKKDGAVAEINVPMADGSVARDISLLPRARVVITESPNGVSRRINNRTTAFETMQYMGNANPLVVNLMSEIVFKSFDHLSEADLASIEEQFAEDREMIKATQRAQLKQAEMTIAQSEMTIAQMGQQMQMGEQQMGMNAQQMGMNEQQMMAQQQQMEQQTQQGAEANAS